MTPSIRPTPRPVTTPAPAHPRRGAGGVLAALVVSLVVVLGALSTATPLSPGWLVAPVAATQTLPAADPGPCSPGSPLPVCTPPPPTTTPPPTTPSTAGSPCIGLGCIPQPVPGTPPPATPGPGQPGAGGSSGSGCGLTNINACVVGAITSFFQGIVTQALNPLLDLLSQTLLTTPPLGSLPQVGQLWTTSWQILLACYGLLVLVAGVLVMGYETVQARYSVKEIAPRLVVGFLAGALSLWAANTGIGLANALVGAIMGGGLNPATAGATLRTLVFGAFTGQVWILLLGVVLVGMLVTLLITYVVRVALTTILIVGAPLALMCHALPQTEGIAYWWWRAYAGCLAIQLGQSLTLITALQVFLAPGGFTLFGATSSGQVNLLVALALTYILVKIPFWVLSALRGSGRRSLVGSLVRGVLIYKGLRLLGAAGQGRKPGGKSGGGTP